MFKLIRNSQFNRLLLKPEFTAIFSFKENWDSTKSITYTGYVRKIYQ